MPARLPFTLPLAAIALLLAACATSSNGAPRGPEPAAECVIPSREAGSSPADSTTSTSDDVRGALRSDAASDAAASDTAITVALTTLMEGAHAPWPRNSGERLLFAQIYEPLVRIDCTGAVVPGVARSWVRDSTSMAGVARWSFVLRGDARFGGGERVRAADVVSSWRASANARAIEPAGSLISAVASGARAVDDSTLVVSLPDSLVELRAFASPQLAIARPTADGSSWPDGTMSYHVDPTLEHYRPDPSDTHQVMSMVGLRARDSATPLLFRVEPDADRRDILDAGTDVLITGSPSAVQYARTQASRATIPLPWTRSYVLVLPSREGDGASAGCIDADLRPLRDALALAVHADARGANGPCWWESEGSGEAARSRPRAGSREILYPIEDATARELAERIVALAAPGREEPAAAALRRAAQGLFEAGGWNAAGVDSTHFAERLERGSDGAFIFALPREPAWPAAARASLRSAAPWLAPLGGTNVFLPLVDTRETLLIRRGRGIPRMTILHDGTVIFGAAASAPVKNASGGSRP